MTATHYNSSSKGPVEISSMNLRHATNALFALQRNRQDDSRDAEIEALQAHVTKLSEEAVQQQATGGGEDTLPAGASFGDLAEVTL
ncbi:hypothetical protein ACO2Q0_02875 [Phenylobacterium sp. VNQ135]|uniref:hypothetical protein n=1 Tax=Phenylobacterium sp. VNQ135 TaxID=3400922 RepID=UPI003C02769E